MTPPRSRLGSPGKRDDGFWLPGYPRARIARWRASAAILAAVLGALLGQPAAAQEPRAPAKSFPCLVDAVRDGDSFSCRGGNVVRLHVADAPELDQPFGPEARSRLMALVAGRELTCIRKGVSYARVVASCTVGALDPAQALVAEGLAWNDRKYGGSYEVEQASAARARAGMWGYAQIPPWTWREIGR